MVGFEYGMYHSRMMYVQYIVKLDFRLSSPSFVVTLHVGLYVLYANSKHPGLPQHLRDDMMPYISEPAKSSVRCTVVTEDTVRVKIPRTTNSLVSTSTGRAWERHFAPKKGSGAPRSEMKVSHICDDNEIVQSHS
jgi:hypothetical protein